MDHNDFDKYFTRGTANERLPAANCPLYVDGDLSVFGIGAKQALPHMTEVTHILTRPQSFVVPGGNNKCLLVTINHKEDKERGNEIADVEDKKELSKQDVEVFLQSGRFAAWIIKDILERVAANQSFTAVILAGLKVDQFDHMSNDSKFAEYSSQIFGQYSFVLGKAQALLPAKPKPAKPYPASGSDPALSPWTKGNPYNLPPRAPTMIFRRSSESRVNSIQTCSSDDLPEVWSQWSGDDIFNNQDPVNPIWALLSTSRHFTQINGQPFCCSINTPWRKNKKLELENIFVTRVQTEGDLGNFLVLTCYFPYGNGMSTLERYGTRLLGKDMGSCLAFFKGRQLITLERTTARLFFMEEYPVDKLFHLVFLANAKEMDTTKTSMKKDLGSILLDKDRENRYMPLSRGDWTGQGEDSEDINRGTNRVMHVHNLPSIFNEWYMKIQAATDTQYITFQPLEPVPALPSYKLFEELHTHEDPDAGLTLRKDQVVRLNLKLFPLYARRVYGETSNGSSAKGSKKPTYRQISGGGKECRENAGSTLVARVVAVAMPTGPLEGSTSVENVLSEPLLVLERWPQEAYPYLGSDQQNKLVVRLASAVNHVKILTEQEQRDELEDLRKYLPKTMNGCLIVKVVCNEDELDPGSQPAGSEPAMPAGSSNPLPFIHVLSQTPRSKVVKEWAAASMKNNKDKGQVVVRLALVPMDASRMEERQLDFMEQTVGDDGYAKFDQIKCPKTAGSYGLLVKMGLKSRTETSTFVQWNSFVGPDPYTLGPLQYSSDLVFRVMPGEPHILEVVWPEDVCYNCPAEVQLVLKDKYGNRCTTVNLNGKVSMTCTSPIIKCALQSDTPNNQFYITAMMTPTAEAGTSILGAQELNISTAVELEGLPAPLCSESRVTVITGPPARLELVDMSCGSVLSIAGEPLVLINHEPKDRLCVQLVDDKGLRVGLPPGRNQWKLRVHLHIDGHPQAPQDINMHASGEVKLKLPALHWGFSSSCREALGTCTIGGLHRAAAASKALVLPECSVPVALRANEEFCRMVLLQGSAIDAQEIAKAVAKGGEAVAVVDTRAGEAPQDLFLVLQNDLDEMCPLKPGQRIIKSKTPHSYEESSSLQIELQETTDPHKFSIVGLVAPTRSGDKFIAHLVVTDEADQEAGAPDIIQMRVDIKAITGKLAHWRLRTPPDGLLVACGQPLESKVQMVLTDKHGNHGEATDYEHYKREAPSVMISRGMTREKFGVSGPSEGLKEVDSLTVTDLKYDSTAKALIFHHIFILSERTSLSVGEERRVLVELLQKSEPDYDGPVAAGGSICITLCQGEATHVKCVTEIGNRFTTLFELPALTWALCDKADNQLAVPDSVDVQVQVTVSKMGDDDVCKTLQPDFEIKENRIHTSGARLLLPEPGDYSISTAFFIGGTRYPAWAGTKLDVSWGALVHPGVAWVDVPGFTSGRYSEALKAGAAFPRNARIKLQLKDGSTPDNLIYRGVSGSLTVSGSGGTRIINLACDDSGTLMVQHESPDVLTSAGKYSLQLIYKEERPQVQNFPGIESTCLLVEVEDYLTVIPDDPHELVPSDPTTFLQACNTAGHCGVVNNSKKILAVKVVDAHGNGVFMEGVEAVCNVVSSDCASKENLPRLLHNRAPAFTLPDRGTFFTFRQLSVEESSGRGCRASDLLLVVEIESCEDVKLGLGFHFMDTLTMNNQQQELQRRRHEIYHKLQGLRAKYNDVWSRQQQRDAKMQGLHRAVAELLKKSSQLDIFPGPETSTMAEHVRQAVGQAAAVADHIIRHCDEKIPRLEQEIQQSLNPELGRELTDTKAEIDRLRTEVKEKVIGAVRDVFTLKSCEGGFTLQPDDASFLSPFFRPATILIEGDQAYSEFLKHPVLPRRAEILKLSHIRVQDRPKRFPHEGHWNVDGPICFLGDLVTVETAKFGQRSSEQARSIPWLLVGQTILLPGLIEVDNYRKQAVAKELYCPRLVAVDGTCVIESNGITKQPRRGGAACLPFLLVKHQQKLQGMQEARCDAKRIQGLVDSDAAEESDAAELQKNLKDDMAHGMPLLVLMKN